METLFFITPIGADSSAERQRADCLFREILEPVCAELQIQAIRADLINTIIRQVIEADYCVYDFAFGKPNVYYECGIRHCTGRPIIHITRPQDSIPFDIKDFVTLFVDTENVPGDQLTSVRDKLRDMLAHAKDRQQCINPVTIAARLNDIDISFIRRTPAISEASTGNPSRPTTDWTGTWLTNFGSVRIKQRGERLRGIYKYHSDCFIGTLDGLIWQDWLLFEFPLKNSEYKGVAFIRHTAVDAFGHWLHSPTLSSIPGLQNQLGKFPDEILPETRRWKLFHHGRITRMLRSLRLVGLDSHAMALFLALQAIQKNEFSKHLGIAIKYWRLAVGLERL